MQRSKLTSGTFLLLSVVAVTTYFTGAPAAAQTERLLHTFNNAGGVDGFNAIGTLLMGKGGNLFGTTTYGGTYNVIDCCGTVFELSPNGSGGFTYSILYSFNPNTNDGKYPTPSLVMDKAGNLYGTTSQGGAGSQGSVFELSAQSNGSWKEIILHNFLRMNDGRDPLAGLAIDPKGNLYGTTFQGPSRTSCGGTGCGTVFELAAKPNGTFSYKTLYNFTGYPADGQAPAVSPTFFQGKLYGSTAFGGSYGQFSGTIFELSPGASGAWTETILHSFGSSSSDASPSNAPLVADSAGNFYGTTYAGGANSFGSVYEFTFQTGGTSTENILYSFSGPDGSGPGYGPVVFDAQGNLYGTTDQGGASQNGVIYELSPSAGGSWTESVIFTFLDNSTGFYPIGGVILDRNSLYGTTEYGGTVDSGVVYQVKR